VFGFSWEGLYYELREWGQGSGTMKLGNDKGRKEDSSKDDRKIKKLYVADGIKCLMKCFESHVGEVQGKGLCNYRQVTRLKQRSFC
jgi:hypothetical protein